MECEVCGEPSHNQEEIIAFGLCRAVRCGLPWPAQLAVADLGDPCESGMEPAGVSHHDAIDGLLVQKLSFSNFTLY